MMQSKKKAEHKNAMTGEGITAPLSKLKLPVCRIITSILLCTFLNACSKSQDSTVNVTPEISNWGSTPTSSKSLMPASLNCSLVPSVVHRGPSWRGLTIGISTYNDLLAALPSAEAYWNTEGGYLYLFNPYPAQEDQENWIAIEACFDGATLSVLNTDSLDWPSQIDQWIVEYGPPDHVTWANDYLNRSLIWSQEGLLAIVEVVFGDTIEVLLFSPISQHDLNSSWLMGSLPSEMPPNLGDEWELAPEQEIEDPWGIEK